MVWQDIVAGTCTLLFTYALVPQIIKGFREKKGVVEFQTGLITSLCLYVLGGTLATLGLWYTASMNLLSGTLWMILFIQRCIYK